MRRSAFRLAHIRRDEALAALASVWQEYLGTQGLLDRVEEGGHAKGYALYNEAVLLNGAASDVVDAAIEDLTERQDEYERALSFLANAGKSPAEQSAEIRKWETVQ
jgi:hypothetical protein